jgi:C4-dicarboxylate-binding protein DctP
MTKVLNRKVLKQLALSASVCAAALFSTQSMAETFTLRIGAGHPTVGLAYTIAAKEFFQPEVAKRVAERTDHEIRWVEAYGGTIAKLSEMIDAVANGLLDVGAISQPFEPTKMFLHNLPSYIPFGPEDPNVALRAMRTVIDEFPIFTEMFEQQWNQKQLAIGAQATYGMGTTFAWETFEDLRGRKLSAAGPNLPWLDNTGATAVQTNLNEAYNALQSGVYEGLIIFAGPWYGFKLHEVAPHYKLVNFGAIPWNSLTVNLNTWNRLPPEVQEIFLEVAEEYEARTGTLEEELQAKAVENLKAEGSNVTELPDEERAKWAEALRDLPNQRAQEAKSRGLPGPETMRRYVEALAEEGYTFPYDYVIED